MEAFSNFLLSVTPEQIIEGAKVAVVVLVLIFIVVLKPEMEKFINWLTRSIFEPKRLEIVGKDGKKHVVASGFPLRITDVSDEE